jgi:predicted permease
VRPPRLAAWLLMRVAPRRRREDIAGDLHELFGDRAARDGAGRARRWYWRQVGAAVAEALDDWWHRPARRGDSPMQTLLEDIRFSLRALTRQPVFTLVAVAILALGIGANATVFSWVNAVLLDPLPGAARQGDLVQAAYTFRGNTMSSFSYPDVEDFSAGATTLDGVAARDQLRVGMVIDRTAERVWGEIVTGNFFEVLGVDAAAGRVLHPSDDSAASAPAVVLGYPFWQARFGGNPAVVGRTLLINARPFTVVGVAAEGFEGGESALRFDFWVPVGHLADLGPDAALLGARGSRWLNVIARLAPGATTAHAQAELGGIVQGFRDRFQGYEEVGVAVYPMAEAQTGGVSVLRPALLVLMAVAVIVLVIACANLAGLLLARASARQREMAIRLAVGAGRWRLVQQLLVEGAVLAVLGTAGALVALQWTRGLIMSFAPPSALPIHLDVPVDLRVVGFTAAIALGTVVLFALLPALQATSTDLLAGLREGGTAGRAFGRHRTRRVLVAAQVALSITLLVGAGLCVRSLAAANTLPPGFTAEGVVVGWMDLLAAGYTVEEGTAFYERVLERVRRLPGVESATLARRIPLGFEGTSSSSLTVEGHTPAGNEPMFVGFNNIGPDYFRTLGTPMVAGREFTDGDVTGAPRVAVINETMARRFWPDGDAVGGRFWFGRERAPEREIRVIGVARDIKQRQFTERPYPYAFLPLLQAPSYQSAVVLHARAAGDGAGLAGALQGVMRELDPGVPFFDVGLLAEHTKAATFQQRMVGELLTVFGGLALLLAAIGSYGVLSFLVGQRRREIGIRLAVGASRGAVFREVASSGGRLIAIGAVAGCVLSLAVGQALRGLLIGVDPLDPATYGVVLGLLGLIAVLACALPARRASLVDPAITLRDS